VSAEPAIRVRSILRTDVPERAAAAAAQGVSKVPVGDDPDRVSHNPEAGASECTQSGTFSGCPRRCTPSIGALPPTTLALGHSVRSSDLDRFSSGVRPIWCQRPGVTQRKTVSPGRVHQQESLQPQRSRAPPTRSASAASANCEEKEQPGTSH
jgi:hypothetical protein